MSALTCSNPVAKRGSQYTSCKYLQRYSHLLYKYNRKRKMKTSLVFNKTIMKVPLMLYVVTTFFTHSGHFCVLSIVEMCHMSPKGIIKSPTAFLYTTQFVHPTWWLSVTVTVNPNDRKEVSETSTKPFSLSTTSPEETHCHTDPSCSDTRQTVQQPPSTAPYHYCSACMSCSCSSVQYKQLSTNEWRWCSSVNVVTRPGFKN
jgi:hypothetical protein